MEKKPNVRYLLPVRFLNKMNTKRRMTEHILRILGPEIPKPELACKNWCFKECYIELFISIEISKLIHSKNKEDFHAGKSSR